MDTKKVDILNIGLVIFSFILAVYIPFKLFLWSYAVLGPLHYLTEINWLNEKNYYIQPKKIWMVVFVILSLLMSFFVLFYVFDVQEHSLLQKLIKMFSHRYSLFLLTGFFFSLGLVYFKKKSLLLVLLGVSFLLAYVLYYLLPKSVMFVGILLPTLIHVYLFTLFFMIYGAIKGSSKWSIYSIVLLVVLPLTLLFINVSPTYYVLTEVVETTFFNSNLISINATLANLFGYKMATSSALFAVIDIKIQIFIAFAYTYHYLNWFSKTTIIGWKNSLSTPRILIILLLWISSVALYWYDYQTGLIVLFFLGMLHVFVEFPLNVISIREIIHLGLKKLSK